MRAPLWIPQTLTHGSVLAHWLFAFGGQSARLEKFFLTHQRHLSEFNALFGNVCFFLSSKLTGWRLVDAFLHQEGSGLGLRWGIRGCGLTLWNSSPSQCALKPSLKPLCSTLLRAISHRSVMLNLHTALATVYSSMSGWRVLGANVNGGIDNHVKPPH